MYNGRILEDICAGKIELVLDLSRLLSRCLYRRPTGVDRVEMSYARHLLSLLPDAMAFSAVNPFGIYGRLDQKAVLSFLQETEARWSQDALPSNAARYKLAIRSLYRLRPLTVPPRTVPRYYLQASPSHLHRPEIVRKKIRREGAAFVCLVHDLIPIEYPEYARPGGASQHRRRMATLAENAALLIANSAATAISMRHFLDSQLHRPPVTSILLGTDDEGLAPANRQQVRDHPWLMKKPYFLMIGTIEPRKNHILLLKIWRRMLELYGPDDTPMLIIAGRRGWENEHVLDMLERSDAIKHHVMEVPHASDDDLATLLSGARALLMPSFAEGFGMPVAEALVARTPTICSDLPALREVGGNVPEYLDPLDGPAWIEAVRQFAKEPSARRNRQIGRMASHKLPTWDDHVMGVLHAIGDHRMSAKGQCEVSAAFSG